MNRLDGCAPGHVARCERIQSEAADRGVQIRWTSGLRSFDEQRRLWDKGRNAAGVIVRPREVVTNAPPGYSWHNYGLASDFVLVRPGGREIEWSGVADLDQDGVIDWLEVGQCAEAESCEWGGRWIKNVDMPHVQSPGDLSIEDAKRIWERDGLGAVWFAAGMARG